MIGKTNAKHREYKYYVGVSVVGGNGGTVSPEGTIGWNIGDPYPVITISPNTADNCFIYKVIDTYSGTAHDITPATTTSETTITISSITSNHDVVVTFGKRIDLFKDGAYNSTYHQDGWFVICNAVVAQTSESIVDNYLTHTGIAQTNSGGDAMAMFRIPYKPLKSVAHCVSSTSGYNRTYWCGLNTVNTFYPTNTTRSPLADKFAYPAPCDVIIENTENILPNGLDMLVGISIGSTRVDTNKFSEIYIEVIP